MKKLVRALAGLVVAGVVVLGVLSWAAGRYVTAELLVEEAEEEINSRVQIGSAEVSLFRLPARIVVRDVILAPRDGEVGKDYGDRTPLEDGPVKVEEVRLAVSLANLLRRKIDVQEFAFEEPKLVVTLDEDGENSLEELLRSPDGEKREKKAKSRGGGESLNVHELGFLARLDGVRSRGGEVDLEITKTKLRIRMTDWNVDLDAIEVDPAALEKTNTARLRLAGRIDIESAKKGIPYARFDLSGPAAVKLFHPETGDLDPEISADLALGEESHINAEIPVVQKAWKGVQLLEKVGIEVKDLPPRAEFGRSRSIAVHYLDDRVTLEKPISVWFDDWELAVVGGSWVQTETDEHAGSAELLASERLSEKFRAEMGEWAGYLPKEIAPAIGRVVEGRIFRDGRLVAELASSGDLSDPDVTVMNLVPEVGELIRKAAGDASRDKLEKLAEDLFDLFSR